MSDGISNRPGPASAAEPSMEEILASIRRILSEEEAGAKPPQEEAELLLTASMRVQAQEFPASGTEPPPSDFMPILEPGPEQKAFAVPQALERPELDFMSAYEAKVVLPKEIDITLPQSSGLQPAPESEKEHYDMEEQVQAPDGLVDDEAVSEISNSIGALVRSVSAERSASVGRPGITIEDIVREEVKPVLKAWLDTHLPSLVERMVRAEINRVMDRAQG